MHDLEDRLRAALAKHARDMDEIPASGPPTAAQGSGGRGMGKAVAALVALVFAGGAVGAGLWMASRGEPETPSAQERILEDPEALSCEEALGAPEPTARRVWPETFAGLWLRPGDRTLVVAFTERAEEKVAKLAECFPRRRFSAVTSQHSMQELEGLINKMATDRELIRVGSLTLPGIPPDTRYVMWIDAARNAIHVVIQEVASETIATFKTRYGDQVIVEEGDVGGPGDPWPAVDPDLSCEDARWGPEAMARGVWPGSFAGLWERPGRTFVAFTEGAEENVAKLAECFPQRRFSAVTFEHSMRELEDLLGRMAADQRRVRAGTLTLPGVPDDRYDMTIFPERNAITVIIEEATPETIATFKSQYGDSVTVEEHDLGGS